MSSISTGGGSGGSVAGVVKFLEGNDSISVGPDITGTIHTLGTHGINTTETWALNNAITLGDLSSIIGSPAITLTTGDITLSAGNVNLPATNTAGTEGCLTSAGSVILAFPGTFNSNILLGVGAGNLNLSNSSRTIAIGTGAGNAITGNQNTIVSYQGFPSITSGANNTGLGYNVGSSLSGAASNNILLGNNSGASLTGTASGNVFVGYGPNASSHSNTISIGFNYTGANTQTTVVLLTVFQEFRFLDLLCQWS